MNKKKVDSILKGVTAAGLTIGGVSSIQGADMVMAQMVESTASETTEMESDIEAASTSAETSQSITEQATEIASESANSQSSSAETKDSNVESQAMEYVYTNKVVETKQEISAAENENINVASTEEVVVTASVSRTGTGYNTLEEVKSAFVGKNNYTVYEMNNGDVVVHNINDKKYTAYYNADGKILSMDVTDLAKTKSDGTLDSINYSYYTDTNHVRKSQDNISKDYNESGVKAGIKVHDKKRNKSLR